MATMANKTLLLGLVLTTLLEATALLVATAAMSVTIYNPATLSVDVVLPGGNQVNQPFGSDGDGDTKDESSNVVKVSPTITTVNLSSPEQDIQIKTGEGHLTDVPVQDGDVFVLIPNSNGDAGGSIFKVPLVPFLPASLRVVPPPPKD